MIFSAGLGTRLQPWTDSHPKALAEVNGKSLLQRNVLYLREAGIHDVIINVHHFPTQIMDSVNASDGWGSRITISDETGGLLETGGGLKKAAWYFSGEQDFVLMNVDILTDLNLRAMIAQHRQNTPLATLAVTQRTTSRYFLFDEHQRLRGWENTTTGETRPAGADRDSLSARAFSGIHVISTGLFPLLLREGKFSMVDVYLDLCAAHTIQSFDHSGSKFIDVGKPASIEAAGKLFG